MNRPSQGEYEEVESPFAAKSSLDKSILRTRKNVFNRPFAADPSVAPAVFETPSRRSIGHPDHTEIAHERASDHTQAEIEYLDEGAVEDEATEIEHHEKRPIRSPSIKKKEKAKKLLLTKLAWAVVGLLVLRLIFMDRGVWDYFATEQTIQEKNDELKSIQKENRELRTEIERIHNDQNYQKQLAKEHLGVIAADEFLILFAGESIDTNSSTIKSNEL